MPSGQTLSREEFGADGTWPVSLKEWQRTLVDIMMSCAEASAASKRAAEETQRILTAGSGDADEAERPDEGQE